MKNSLVCINANLLHRLLGSIGLFLVISILWSCRKDTQDNPSKTTADSTTTLDAQGSVTERCCTGYGSWIWVDGELWWIWVPPNVLGGLGGGSLTIDTFKIRDFPYAPFPAPTVNNSYTPPPIANEYSDFYSTCGYIRQYIIAAEQYPPEYYQVDYRLCELIHDLSLNGEAPTFLNIGFCLWKNYQGSAFLDEIWNTWSQSDKSPQAAEQLREYIEGVVGNCE